MTDQERNLLIDVKGKVKLIIARNESLKQEKDHLKGKIGDLERTISQLKEANIILEQKYKNLKLAKMLAASDDETKDAKSKIQKIVREIDKCIALLNQ
jgi:vacuolar-type H+-ATPase subunit D/Vma8